MRKKLYILFFFVNFFSSRVFALNEPELRCLQVENNGSVKLTWVHPTDIHNLHHYEIFRTDDGTTFTRIHTITLSNPASPDVNSWIDAGANANTNLDVCYYVASVSQSGTAFESNRLCVMGLEINNNQYQGIAELRWTPPISPALSTYDPYYQIYSKGPYDPDFVWIGNATNLNFLDTIDICQGWIDYKIILADNSANCSNVSRIYGDNFADKMGPEVPLFDSVSVDFNTGLTHLGWQPSSSSDAYAYIIYYMSVTDGWIPVDTVYGRETTSWTDHDRIASSTIYQYRIAALDSCLNSSVISRDPLRTMSLTCQVDDCAQKISVNWTPYENMRGGQEGYAVYYSLNGGTPQLAGEVDVNTRNYTLNDIADNSHYKFVVKAFGNNGEIYASSVTGEVNTAEVTYHHFAYIRYASVAENKNIELAIYTSGDTLPFTNMKIYRSQDNTSNFSLVVTLPYNGNANYTYTDENLNVERKYYYYKAVLINECDREVANSNVVHNIVLSGETNDAHLNTLRWRDFGDWQIGVDDYTIHRKMESDFNFVEIDRIPSNVSNSFYDDVSDLFGYGSDFLYYVVAEEIANSYGFQDKSASNYVTLRQLPTTYIPNAFNPSGQHNPVFMPVNSFVSMENYHFSVYSRTGQLIFTTNDPYKGWDGTMDGRPAQMDVYIYQVYYTYPDGTPYERSGSLTLIR